MKYIKTSDNPVLSIIFPHYISPINDECLSLVTRCFAENTTNSYELIIIDEEGDPYKLWNDHIEKCKSEITIFSNTDCIPCKGWDEPYVKNYDPDTIFTQYLIEPGALGVAPENFQKLFGWCPRCFQRDKFEEYATRIMQRYKDWRADGGWPMPCCMPKSLFIKHGKFNLSAPFMHAPVDLQLWDKMRKAGVKIRRCESVFYHFQNFSARKNLCNCYEQISRRPGE